MSKRRNDSSNHFASVWDFDIANSIFRESDFSISRTRYFENRIFRYHELDISIIGAFDIPNWIFRLSDLSIFRTRYFANRHSRVVFYCEFRYSGNYIDQSLNSLYSPILRRFLKNNSGSHRCFDHIDVNSAHYANRRSIQMDVIIILEIRACCISHTRENLFARKYWFIYSLVTLEVHVVYFSSATRRLSLKIEYSIKPTHSQIHSETCTEKRRLYGILYFHW